jgi:hypothetical protein
VEHIKISAKVLGQLAMDDFCSRCFWIKMHTKTLPWQIFPGIFSSIDAYTKKVVHHWIDNGTMPDFMRGLRVVGYEKTPHWSKFYREIPSMGITLSGVPDDFWVTDAGCLHIPDYKTAKFTKTQDKLFPMYEVQGNGYGWIAAGQGRDVSGLSLIYMEPVTTEESAKTEAGNADGPWRMQFSPHYLPIEMDFDRIEGLLQRVRLIYDDEIPEDTGTCKDCEALNNIIGIATK